MQLTTSELQTLEVISDRERADTIPRTHLEKLSRLDLIEPTGCKVSLSLKGKKILFGNR